MYKKYLNKYVQKRLQQLEFEDKKTDASEPQKKDNDFERIKKENLNQPNPKNKEKINWRKVLWWSVGGIVVVGIFAGIAVSFAGSGAKHFDVKEVSATDGESFTLTSANGDKRTIRKGTIPTVYLNSNDQISIVYGNNFSGFFITASLVRLTNNTTGPDIYILLGNIRIDNATGTVEKKGTTTGANSGSAKSPLTNLLTLETDAAVSTETWTKDSNLTTAMKDTFQGLASNASVQAQSTNWLGVILNILPLIVSIIIIVLIFKSFKGMQGGAAGGADSIFGIGKSQAKIAQSDVKFTDVAGIEEEKGELIEIVDYLKRPERYAAMGARVPKGVILYGPPGTGKTLLAKAVAGEAKVPFFQVSGSAFEDMLVGVGAKRVRDLFQKAVKAAPSIIFIDEIDSVGSKRGKLETTSGSLADQTLNQLLAEMDGFSGRSGVIVMAATNRLDVLDEALLRPGRFDRHIQVNLPDIKERTAILQIHSRNKNLSKSVDLEDISRRTPGFSGAQLENVLNEATLLAVRKNKTSINTEDLDEAIDRVIAGPAKKTRVISPEEKKQIAYHEAGHALVGLHTKGSDVVQKITIIPRGQAAGYTLSVPEIQELSIQKKSDLLGMIAGALGGRASEEIIYGKDAVSTGASNDLYKVTNIVRSMVMQLGMSDVGMTQYVPSEGSINPYQQKLYSETTALAIDKEIDRIIKKQYEYACKIIRENRKELDLIVESLLTLETIVKPQIDYIHKHKQLPKEVLEKKAEQQKKKEEEAKTKKQEESKSSDNKKENSKEEQKTTTSKSSDNKKENSKDQEKLESTSKTDSNTKQQKQEEPKEQKETKETKDKKSTSK
ncbi:ATP-dependent zinc metalloprotease FtsH [Malacoplasma iowae]|uniref:ATP-dependent zinc metalloprotease FtsH n=1 Tax=Malacoplasma iowae 695 TaxID=1048830 RepID=A0A6P1LFP1_MALIO|nr:cell division protein FtsH [Malacoplasma iowae 695]QHG90299.2 ATP-dependent zinc metalloprotease FtsH [Malacoplasma iowae 695]VEU62219.1 AAA ATPase [Mycoplasmopsis fermentans]VEU72498.1 AAA ATPase [Malacoplasma iowae]